MIAAALAMLVQAIVPLISALLVAIILGVVVAHSTGIPPRLEPGIKVSAKRILRIGIVLLGLQIALGEIIGLGWPMLLVVTAVVVIGCLGTLLIGRLLGVSLAQSLLIGVGFSICGAAAVAAIESTIDREDEEVVTAIALVVIFGTSLMLLAPPFLVLSGMDEHVQGLVAGAAIHEVAQVVAAGGILGGAALTAAVVVKLARVLLLAPVVMAITVWQRSQGPGNMAPNGRRPPLVPLFVAGFLAASLIRTFVPLSPSVLSVGLFLQTLLLSAAMFALGSGVHVRVIRKAGARTLALGALSTCLVGAVAIMGVSLVG